MRRNILEAGLLFLTICSLGACGVAGQRTEISGASGSTGSGAESREGSSYGSAWQMGDIQGNPAMEEAYRMGKAIC